MRWAAPDQPPVSQKVPLYFPEKDHHARLVGFEQHESRHADQHAKAPDDARRHQPAAERQPGVDGAARPRRSCKPPRPARPEDQHQCQVAVAFPAFVNEIFHFPYPYSFSDIILISQVYRTFWDLQIFRTFFSQPASGRSKRGPAARFRPKETAPWHSSCKVGGRKPKQNLHHESAKTHQRRDADPTFPVRKEMSRYRHPRNPSPRARRLPRSPTS